MRMALVSSPRAVGARLRAIISQQPAPIPRIPACRRVVGHRRIRLGQRRFSAAVLHSHYSQRGGFAIYWTGTIRARSGGLAMRTQGSRSRWLAFASVLAAVTIAAAGSDQAQARAKSKREARPRAIHRPSYHPPYAAIVIDDKSGAVLHDVSADGPRHPASLTKIMTLYLLFEQLEAGTLKLDTALPV